MKVVALSSIASLVLGAALLSVSPPGCSCETPVMEFGWEAEMFAPPEYAAASDLTAKAVEAALRKRHVGRSLSEVAPPAALREGECEWTADILSCRYWVASGPIRKEGLSIHFHRGPDGNVQKVRVSDLTQWFGRT